MLLYCDAGEDSRESLGQQGDKPVSPKGNQSWIVIGRTDAEAEAPIFWPLDMKSQLIGRDPDAEKDWRQEEKGMTEMRWLSVITDSMSMNLSNLWAIVKDMEAWHAAVHEVTESWTGLSKRQVTMFSGVRQPNIWSSVPYNSRDRWCFVKKNYIYIYLYIYIIVYNFRGQ